MINGVAVNKDSLVNGSGETYALPQELNLEDYFFHKGIRIEKTLIQDLYCAPIVLASGYENDVQYIPYPWVYYPIIKPKDSTIGKNTGPILCRYASPIKTIENKFSKFLLLKSSDFIKTSSFPAVISLKKATSKIEPSTFLQKSKAISGLSKLIVNKHNSKVPQNFKDLEDLPGVGHKTASVVMSQAFGYPAFPVDTHIHRLAWRWGLSTGKNVEKTEKDLKRLFPESKWNKLHLQIIFYGREYCPARGHNLEFCIICSKYRRKEGFK